MGCSLLFFLRYSDFEEHFGSQNGGMTWLLFSPSITVVLHAVHHKAEYPSAVMKIIRSCRIQKFVCLNSERGDC